MPFNIGSPFSPQVTAALLRRGETGRGGRITHQDPIRRTMARDEDQGPSELELLREKRLDEAMRMNDERLGRGEERDQAAFDFQRDMATKAFERQERLDKVAAEKSGKPDPKEMRTLRSDGRKIIMDIQKILTDARKTDPNTGKVDPVALQQARQWAAILWQQYAALGLPPEEIARAAEMLGISPSAPPDRGTGGAWDATLSGADPRGGQAPGAGAISRTGAAAPGRPAPSALRQGMATTLGSRGDNPAAYMDSQLIAELYQP